MKSLISGSYHYIRNYDGCEEVYDFVNDPQELNDLTGFAVENGLIEVLRKSLGP